jgi:hypothetical protein
LQLRLLFGPRSPAAPLSTGKNLENFSNNNSLQQNLSTDAQQNLFFIIFKILKISQTKIRPANLIAQQQLGAALFSHPGTPAHSLSFSPSLPLSQQEEGHHANISRRRQRAPAGAAAGCSRSSRRNLGERGHKQSQRL